MRRLRPSLLVLMALAATLSGVAHGVGVIQATTAGPVPAPATRLGVSIAKDQVAHDKDSAGRSRSLDLREQAAKATEERIKADLATRAAPPSPTKNGAVEGGEQFDSLARVYQAMKPASAAVVFEKLDMNVQMQIAKRMRDRSTALILASMSPQAATDLSMALARKSAVIPVRTPTAGVPAGAPAAGPLASAPAIGR